MASTSTLRSSSSLLRTSGRERCMSTLSHLLSRSSNVTILSTASKRSPLHHLKRSLTQQQRHQTSSTPKPPKTTSTNAVRDMDKVGKVAPEKETFLTRFLGPKEMPPRYSFAWYLEMLLICTVFGITGTSSMMIVRPAVKNVLQIDGNFRDGPWSYRICTLVLISPIYATLLVAVGTVFGRHAYFRHFSVKIFSRFGIPPELMDKNWKVHQKTFKRW